MRTALYARTSTDLQTCENQLRELRQIAEYKGITIVAEFIDAGISGSKGRDKRPEFDALIKGAIRKDFDSVMVWAVDRLGRSLQDLVAFLNELHSVGCDLYIHQSGIDTQTPAGKMMFQMCGVFAEFERGMIQQRVKLGQARARSEGKHIGRPSSITEGLVHSIKYMRQQGLGIRRISRDLQVGVGTIYKVLDSQESRVAA
jgi:DNA invertase Pin-like site-specific DNA recombinase